MNRPARVSPRLSLLSATLVSLLAGGCGGDGGGAGAAPQGITEANARATAGQA